LSTVTAGRIAKGQLANELGDEHVTFMENLDHSALAKTYNIDAQTPDSAGTATAYLTGVKTKQARISVDGRADNCSSSKNSSLESILKWAHSAGKSTGIITTTRLTHATPAAAYASIFHREMESTDGIYHTLETRSEGCEDIATQFVEQSLKINLVFAGGSSKFLPLKENEKDNSSIYGYGDRVDKKNLISEWHTKMAANKKKHKYLSSYQEFNNLKPNENDHVLGLFSSSHMSFETDRDISKQPSLSEMVAKAIDLLKTNPKGYFLFIEGGRIDHAHHNSNAYRALTE
jgi:alkaline phosphatase